MVAFKLLALLGSVGADINIENTCRASNGDTCDNEVDVASALQSRRVHHRYSRLNVASSVVEKVVEGKSGGGSLEDSVADKIGFSGGNPFENMMVDKKSIEQLDSEIKDMLHEIETLSDEVLLKSSQAHEQFLQMLDNAIPPEVNLQENYESLVQEVERMQDKLEDLETKARKRFETLTQKVQKKVSGAVDDVQDEFDKWTGKLDEAYQDLGDLFLKMEDRFKKAQERSAAAIARATEVWDTKMEAIRASAQEFETHIAGEVGDALDDAATVAMAAMLLVVEGAVEAEEWMAGQIKKAAARAEQLEAKAQEKMLELSEIVLDQRKKAQWLYAEAKESGKEKLSVLKTKAKESFEEVQTKMQSTYDTISQSASDFFSDAESKIVAGIDKLKDEAADFTEKALDFKEKLETTFADASDEVKDAIRQKQQEAEAMKEKLIQAYSRTALKLEEMIMDKIEAQKQKIENAVTDARLKLQAAKDGFADAVDETTANLQASYDALVDRKDEIVRQIEAAREQFRIAKEKIESAIADAKDATKEAIDEIGDAFQDLGQKIRDIFSR